MVPVNYKSELNISEILKISSFIVPFAFTYYWMNRLSANHIVKTYFKMITYNFNFSPNQYRMLPFWIVSLIDQITSFFMHIFLSKAIIEATTIYRMLLLHKIIIFSVVWISLISFYIYLRYWFNQNLSLCGTMLLGLLLILGNSYGNTYQNATHFWILLLGNDEYNLLVTILGLFSIRHQKLKLLYPILFLGALNRETIAILIPIFLIWQIYCNHFEENQNKIRINKIIFHTLLLLGTFFIPYILIRIIIGPLPYWGNFFRISENIVTFTEWWILHGFLCFTTLYFLSINGLPKVKKSFFYTPLVIIPPYYVLHFLIAMMRELRLFIPLFIFLIPLILGSYKNGYDSPNLDRLSIMGIKIKKPKSTKLFILTIVLNIVWFVIFMVMLLLGFSSLTNI